MEVNGFDVDVRVESVFVEKHRAASVVGHMEPVGEEFMIYKINRLLQGDNVPFSCNLFFNCAFFAALMPWIPVVDAQSLLNVGARRHVGIKEIFLGG